MFDRIIEETHIHQSSDAKELAKKEEMLRQYHERYCEVGKELRHVRSMLAGLLSELVYNPEARCYEVSEAIIALQPELEKFMRQVKGN